MPIHVPFNDKVLNISMCTGARRGAHPENGAGCGKMRRDGGRDTGLDVVHNQIWCGRILAMQHNTRKSVVANGTHCYIG